MIENSKNFPRRYFARHIKAGPVHYLEKGEDKLYVIQDEALKKMNASFEGKPIYIRHVEEVDTDKMKEEAVGYVVKSFYNEFDGAWWVEIIADDEAQKFIEKGWAVSNAYLPTELGSGGVYHDINYDKEVKNGVYEHLAIVDNPRYEEAVIMTPEEFKDFNEGRKAELDKLKNSKENEMLSEEDKKELLDSLKNSLSEIVKDTVKNALDEKHAEDKKNAEDEEEDKKEEEKKDEESKDNESDEDSEKENKCNEGEEEKEEKKENSKFFNFLHNAKSASDKNKTVDTMASGLARGRARYGSK